MLNYKGEKENYLFKLQGKAKTTGNPKPSY